MTRSSRRARLGASSLFAVAAASAIHCVALVDTDGLSGGPASAREDSSATSADAKGSVADADGTADASSPCLLAHAFCDDFEKGALGAMWSPGVVITGTASIAFDVLAAHGQRAIRSTMPPAANDTRRAYLEHTRTRAGAGVRVTFDALIGDFGITENYTLAGLSFGPGALGGQRTANMYFNDDGGRIYVQTPSGSGISGRQLPTNRYVHLVFEVFPLTSGGTAVLTEVPATGAPVEIVRVTGLAYEADPPGPRTVRLQLGLARYNVNTPALDVRYDNLTVDDLP